MEAALMCEYSLGHHINTINSTATTAKSTAAIATATSATGTAPSATGTAASVSNLLTLYGVAFFLIGVAFVFNKIGIALCIRAKTVGIANQNLLFAHLSFISIVYLGLTAIGLSWKTRRVPFERWFFVCFNVLSAAYITSLMVMACERLLFVILRLRYCIVVTKLVISLMVVSVWVVSVPYGMSYQLTGSTVPPGWELSLYVFNAVGMGVAVLCYAAIEFDIQRPEACERRFLLCCSKFYQPCKSATGDAAVPPNAVHTNVKRRKYSVTFVIILLHFLTGVLPAWVGEGFHGKCGREWDLGLLVLVLVRSLNFVLIPPLYLFPQPNIRKLFRSLLSKASIFARKVIDKLRRLSQGANEGEKEKLIGDIKVPQPSYESTYVECCVDC